MKSLNKYYERYYVVRNQNFVLFAGDRVLTTYDDIINIVSITEDGTLTYTINDSSLDQTAMANSIWTTLVRKL